MARPKNYKAAIEKAQDKVEKMHQRFIAKYEKLIASKKRPAEDQTEAVSELYNDLVSKIHELHDVKDEATEATETE